MTYEEAYKKLKKAGQTHVLQYYEELSEEEKKGLLDQIELTDFSVLKYCSNKEELTQKGVISPLSAMQLPMPVQLLPDGQSHSILPAAGRWTVLFR